MRNSFARYLAAIAMSLVAALVQVIFLPFFSGIPFFLGFVSVFVSALVCGFGPSLLVGAAYAPFAIAIMGADPLKAVLFAGAGAVVSWFVSARRRADEARNKEATSLLTTIANTVPAIVWITDAERQCTYVNDRWLEFSGRKREDELGFGWLSEMHEDDVATSMAIFESAFSGRRPVQLEYRQRRHDGAYRRMLSRGVPRFDVDGAFAGYIGVALDIEDLRHAESERTRLAAEVEHERERLLAIVSNVPGVVWEAWGDPDEKTQRINFVSDHVERMLGYSTAEWLSTPNFWLSIVHPDDREAASRHAHDHYLAGGAATNRFRWITKDGRAIWCEAHSTVIHDAAGNPAGMRGVTLDITARKRAEDSLQFLARASEKLASSLDYEATINATAELGVPAFGDWCTVGLFDRPDPYRSAIVHSDPQKNALAQTLMTMPRRKDMPADIIAKFAKLEPFILDIDDELLPKITYNEQHAAIVRELGCRSMLVVPIAARDKPLGTLTFMSGTPNRYDQADLELASLLARRAAIAIDNTNLYKAAVDASAAKDEVLATVSHELRTPMTATLGWVRLLSLGQLDAETQKTALHAIENATASQARLIDDILDVSSIVLGKFRLERGPVDLRTVVDRATEALAPTLTAKAITIDVDTSRWHGVVQGDASRLQQIVWNLLANAVKFGHRAGHIDVALERDDDVARIIVRDDGSGIDPEFLPHMFDRFRQAEGGSTRSHGGLGLGLAIVRHLAELHGGTVHADSPGRGKGATFTVEIPAPVEADESPHISLPNLARKQILVVDNEQPTLDFVSTVLRQCGAGVTTARSADEALLALNAADHDLVLTDISMPDVDGYAMMREVRAIKPSMPAIALTARNDVVHDGFARVLRKPIDPLELAAQVAAVLA
jgi:PAS domain S-box-containing protein